MSTDVNIDRSRATDYETIFILRADIDTESSEKVIARAVAAIETGGGKLLKLESWGKRRLAFPIQKQRKGFYVYVRYLGYQGLVAELERNLRMLDTVLRHLTVQLRKNVDPKSINVDPEEVKIRRIEIADTDEDREDSLEASLGMSDERREKEEEDEDAIDAEQLVASAAEKEKEKEKEREKDATAAAPAPTATEEKATKEG